MSAPISDAALLKRVLEHPITHRQRELFECHAAEVDAGAELSRRERAHAWATIRTHEPEYENLVSSGKVKRGAEVPLPPALQNLPKKPPHRRHET